MDFGVKCVYKVAKVAECGSCSKLLEEFVLCKVPLDNFVFQESQPTIVHKHYHITNNNITNNNVTNNNVNYNVGNVTVNGKGFVNIGGTVKGVVIADTVQGVVMGDNNKVEINTKRKEFSSKV